ncbi:MAG: hypothetical protein APZ16_04530 [Candidatus Hadarchaeum yellowstonense]|uniref:Uncharacterized protein n=1 Tax=Hadarchaeum yellowstonense TaxID=1776334 RepID=A0A147JVX7_HADYE|nr:MAG: hypothetical protein APZ16_04530 [Candidatus Hadarchaeum yellowstonense]
MNVLFKLGSLLALFTTVAKIVANMGWISHPVLTWIAANAAFLYGLAVGLAVAGLTRKIVLILLAITGVYIVLKLWGGM